MTPRYLSKRKYISNKNKITSKNEKKKKSKTKHKKNGGYVEPSLISLTESKLESNEIRNLWEDIKLPNVNKLNHIFPYTYPFPMKNIDEIEESKVENYKWKQNESIPNLLSKDTQYFFTNPDFNKKYVFDTIREKKTVNPLKQFKTEKEVFSTLDKDIPINKFWQNYCDKGTEVDKCFKKKVLNLHPDKGGDYDKFLEFSGLYKKITNKKGKCPT